MTLFPRPVLLSDDKKKQLALSAFERKRAEYALLRPLPERRVER